MGREGVNCRGNLLPLPAHSSILDFFLSWSAVVNCQELSPSPPNHLHFSCCLTALLFLSAEDLQRKSREGKFDDSCGDCLTAEVVWFKVDHESVFVINPNIPLIWNLSQRFSCWFCRFVHLKRN